MSKLCIRTCLNNLYLRLRSSKENCPRLVVASLLSEHESLDTIMHLIVAQNVGWDITYIGNGVPHDEITYAASNVRAQLVVLAINNQRDIARKIYEIKHIRDNAEKTEDIILIGRQCNEFRQLTNQLNINIANDWFTDTPSAGNEHTGDGGDATRQPPTSWCNKTGREHTGAKSCWLLKSRWYRL